jgi:branched-chain amino acid transport system ATP-binding protein
MYYISAFYMRLSLLNFHQRREALRRMAIPLLRRWRKIMNGMKRRTLSCLALAQQGVRGSFALVDRDYLLEAGRIAGAGTAAALSSRPTLQRAFFGGAAATVF